MTDEERFEQIREEIRRHAMAVEDNAVVPGQPTLVGWLEALWDETASLRRRVEDLEQNLR